MHGISTRGPVVSLRSTTGYPLRCVRHRDIPTAHDPAPTALYPAFSAVIWLGHLQTTEIGCNSTGRINLDKSVATPLMRVTLDMNTPTRTVLLYLECGSVNPGVFGADYLPCNRDDSGLIERDHRVRGRGRGLSRRLHLRRAPRHNPYDNDI